MGFAFVIMLGMSLFPMSADTALELEGSWTPLALVQVYTSMHSFVLRQIDLHLESLVAETARELIWEQVASSAMYNKRRSRYILLAAKLASEIHAVLFVSNLMFSKHFCIFQEMTADRTLSSLLWIRVVLFDVIFENIFGCRFLSANFTDEFLVWILNYRWTAFPCNFASTAALNFHSSVISGNVRYESVLVDEVLRAQITLKLSRC